MAAVACAQACVCLLCVGRGEIAHAVRGDVSPMRALPHRGESPARGTRILRAHGAGQIAGYGFGTTIAKNCLGQKFWCLLYATATLSDDDPQGNGQIVAPSPHLQGIVIQAGLSRGRRRQGSRMLEGVPARWGVWLLLSRTKNILSSTLRRLNSPAALSDPSRQSKTVLWVRAASRQQDVHLCERCSVTARLCSGCAKRAQQLPCHPC